MRGLLTRRDSILIFLILLLAYGYVMPRWADWSQNSRVNLVRAMVEQGTTRIDAYVENTGDYALFEGHAYTDKAPGPAFAGLPFYAAVSPLLDQPFIASKLAGLAGGGAMSSTLNPEGTGIQNDKIRHFVALLTVTITTVAIPAAAFGVLLYATLGWFGFSRGIRLVVTLGYALATPALAYAGNFYSHQFTAVLLFGAFALLLGVGETRLGDSTRESQGAAFSLPRNRTSSRPIRRALLFGLLCGFALISEYPSTIIIAAFGVVALLRFTPRQLGVAVVGGLLPLMLMTIYDLRSFGTIIPVGYAHSALWQDQHHTGFLSITYPRPEALWGLTFSPFRGLFVRAPWLLLAVPGFVLWWRTREQRTAWWVALVATVGLTLFYGSSVMWWGGYGVGPRYLVPMLPFLALATAYAIRWLWKSLAGRVATIALVSVSGVLTWAETVAGQTLPPDSFRQPWFEYTVPAWIEGHIARNFGMALGLQGVASLIPLAILMALMLTFLLVPRRPLAAQEAATEQCNRPTPATSVVSEKPSG